MGPIQFSKYVCEQGTLATEQRGPVALVARDMQIVFDEEVARRANLTDAQLRAEGVSATDRVTLPLKDVGSVYCSMAAEVAGKPELSIVC